jgi:glycosidase
MANIPSDWRVFHIVTSKVPNGNPKNLHGLNRGPLDLCLPQEHDRWGGGDWEGVRLYVLPFMKSVGFNALQISPITRCIEGVYGMPGTPSEGKLFAPNHAYHPFKLAPSANSIELEPHFGSKAELIRLIQTAHQMGIKMIADIIPNHLGYQTPDLLEHPEWFYNQDDLAQAILENDSVRKFTVKEMAGLPGLRHEHHEVRRRLDVLWQYHIALGFDAYRIDALMHCGAFYQEYLAKYSPLAGYPLIGEGHPSFGENYAGSIHVNDKGHEIGGHTVMWKMGFGSTGHPLFFCLQEEASKTGNEPNVEKLGNLQRELYYHNAQNVNFIDNHDTERSMTVALFNGNSVVAATERVHLQLVLLYGFISPPAVLYGTEQLFEGWGVRGEGMKPPRPTSNRGVWTPSAKATPTQKLLRELNHARASEPALESGWYDERYLGNGVLCYVRGYGQDRVLVVCNLWDSEVNTQNLPGTIQLADHFGDTCVLRDLTSQVIPGTFTIKDGRLHGVIPPRHAFLLSAV